jgi:hypothetical protein
MHSQQCLYGGGRQRSKSFMKSLKNGRVLAQGCCLFPDFIPLNMLALESTCRIPVYIYISCNLQHVDCGGEEENINSSVGFLLDECSDHSIWRSLFEVSVTSEATSVTSRRSRPTFKAKFRPNWPRDGRDIRQSTRGKRRISRTKSTRSQ